MDGGDRSGHEEQNEQEDPEEHARKALRDIESDEASYRQAEEEGKSRAAEEDPEITDPERE